VLLTTADLAADAPLPDRCGTCRACLDACPTGAFPEPYVLDSRRCISYLTIEHRGEIDPALRPGMAGWQFGCDICQTVCPWNRKAPESRHAEFHARAPYPDAETVARMADEEVRATFRGSAMLRAKPAGLRRNALIYLENRLEPES
jgi:epoxyqueuosine reductase